MDDLREHLEELDQSKPVYVNCQTGHRSYLACRLLTQYGFSCAHLSGGYSFYQVVTQEGQTAQSAYPCGGPVNKSFCYLQSRNLHIF